MAKPRDYKHIEVWGQMMSSLPYYIHDQQVMAAEDNAPIDAIYKQQDNTWAVFSEITSPETINYFAQRGITQEPKP